MALKLTCPACAARFALAEDVRGKEAFCPKCGASLVVTSAGVAKELKKSEPAHATPGREVVPLWLLVAVPLFVLAGGLILYLFSGGQVDEQKQAAKHDRDQPLPAPHQEAPPVEAPHALPKKEPEKPAVKLPMKPLDHLKPPVAMRPADQLVHLVENNMVLAGKALPGQPFTCRLPTVAGAHFELNGPPPTGLTLSPEGLLNWTPPLGQHPATYDVRLKTNPSNLVRTVKIVLELDPATALALPGIGGWVMHPDGVTLIVALPDEAKLVYIDTVANKEIKRVDAPFKPNLLAVQGRNLFVSAQSASELHVFELDTGAELKTVKLPASYLTDMVCHPQRGLVYAIEAGYSAIVTIDPFSGVAERVKIVALNPRGVGTGVLADSMIVHPVTRRRVITDVRGISLAIDPGNPNALYAIWHTSILLWPDMTQDRVFLSKFIVNGRDLEVMFADSGVSPPGDQRHRVIVRVNSDGTRIAAIAGARGGNGNPGGISLYDAVGPTGIADCGNYPGDLAFHPVLDLGAAEQDYVLAAHPGGRSEKQTILHVFNCKSLVETKFTLSAERPDNKLKPARGLLTFGARGTKLLFYDWAHGYLRSLPLTLTDKEKDALAAAYPIPAK